MRYTYWINQTPDQGDGPIFQEWAEAYDAMVQALDELYPDQWFMNGASQAEFKDHRAGSMIAGHVKLAPTEVEQAIMCIERRLHECGLVSTEYYHDPHVGRLMIELNTSLVTIRVQTTQILNELNRRDDR